MSDCDIIAAAGISASALETDRIPDLILRHLLNVYGIRIWAMREEVSAEPAKRNDCNWLRLKGPAADGRSEKIRTSGP